MARKHEMDNIGAIELSIGTMVVIVLAMAMLIMGLVLVNKIFSGATQSVDTINDNVRAQINGLFSNNNQKVAILLPGNSVSIPKGQSFGIAFGVRDTTQGSTAQDNFHYDIEHASIASTCQGANGISEANALSYIYLAKSGDFSLSPGDTYNQIFKIQPPSNAPLCEIAYNLVVRKDGAAGPVYDTQQFFVKITA